MNRHRKPLSIVVLCTMIYLFSCVTINIYFPAEKVESVAEEFVDDVRGLKGDDGGSTPADKNTSLLKRTLLALSPSFVWAQEETTVSNPTIRALKEKMKARFGQMKPYYRKGMLKEQDDGYVSIVNTQGLGLKEKRDLQTLVDAENRDRKRLYEEVAKALKIDPGQVNKIAEIFAKEFQKPIQ